MTIDHLKNKERLFLLSLDPLNGQEVAAQAGFTPTGGDVRIAETRHLLRSWAKLQALGVGSHVEQQTEWFVALMERMVGHELPSEYKLQQQVSLMTFTLAALQGLHRDGLVTINNLDTVALQEVIIDRKTRLPVDPPDDYAAAVAEFEVLLQENRLVDEPLPRPWGPPTSASRDPMHDDDPTPQPLPSEEPTDEQ